MKSAVAILIFLCVPGAARAVHFPHLKSLPVAVLAASEFDAATTYRALKSCAGACHEANPALRPFAGNISIFPVMLATGAMINFSAARLRGAHPKTAKALLLITVGVHTAAGISNARR